TITSSDLVNSSARRSSGLPIVHRLVLMMAHPVAQPLGLLQPAGGEEDGDPAVPSPAISPCVTAILFRISAAPSGPTGMPATGAEPTVGEISVARIRTVVVLSARLRIMCHLTSGNWELCRLSSTGVRRAGPRGLGCGR